MLFDRPNWPPHRPWVFLFVLGSLASIVWFAAASRDAAQWPGGSSVPGFTFGVIGGLIILFEFLLWFRKKVRVWRIGKAKSGLRAHIWLGLLCVPLLILHSGFRLGGLLSTVLMALLVIVVVSGIVGLILQNLLPKRMLEEIPAETIYSQMDVLAGQLVAEAERLVSATCGTRPVGVETGASGQPSSGPIVVGAVRSVGSVQGMVLGARVPTAPIAETEALAVFFAEQVAPFLRRGTAGSSRLSSASQAAVLFRDLRARVPPAAHDAVTALENYCEQRRQWDSQARLHFWLHSWLWVHFPLSVALVVLMAVHVVVALKYW